MRHQYVSFRLSRFSLDADPESLGQAIESDQLEAFQNFLATTRPQAAE